VEEVLDAVDGDGAVLVGEVEDAFDAEELFALGGDEHFEPGADGLPVERLFEGHAEGADGGVVAVGVVVMAMVTVVGVDVEPGLDVGGAGGGVEACG